jgi:hypothetical protein
VTQLVDEVEYVNEATGESEIIVAEPMERGYATPEEAALSGYGENAQAYIVSVERVNDWEANVIVDTVPSHPVTSNVHRDLRGLWTEWSSSGGAAP